MFAKFSWTKKSPFDEGKGIFKLRYLSFYLYLSLCLYIWRETERDGKGEGYIEREMRDKEKERGFNDLI